VYICLRLTTIYHLVLLVSPRIVETRGRWATHRNLGLSMMIGGYVHEYVMDFFAATVMQEQCDGSLDRNNLRPRCLKYIMYSDTVVRFFLPLITAWTMCLFLNNVIRFLDVLYLCFFRIIFVNLGETQKYSKGWSANLFYLAESISLMLWVPCHP